MHRRQAPRIINYRPVASFKKTSQTSCHTDLVECEISFQVIRDASFSVWIESESNPVVWMSVSVTLYWPILSGFPMFWIGLTLGIIFLLSGSMNYATQARL